MACRSQAWPEPGSGIVQLNSFQGRASRSRFARQRLAFGIGQQPKAEVQFSRAGGMHRWLPTMSVSTWIANPMCRGKPGGGMAPGVAVRELSVKGEEHLA